MTPAKRRTKGEGGLTHRHDHATCPPLEIVGYDDDCEPIMERPDHPCKGRWQGTIVAEIDGKKRRKSVYGRTQKEARIKLATALRERDQGTLVLTNMTVAAWMDHWLEKIAARRVRPQTLAGYRSKVSTLIVPYLGSHRLTTLRPEHLRNWHDDLRATGGKPTAAERAKGITGKPLAEASVRQAHAILKKALSDAVNDGKIGSNPADKVDSPSTYKAKRKALTVAQAQTALGRTGNDAARWWLAIFYGMRQGECLGLRWGDVDFDRKVLRIEQTLQMDNRKIIFGPPKTDASAREIPLLPPVVLALKLHRPSGYQPDDLVFTDSAGGPVKPWDDNRAWHVFLKGAGLPDVPLHAARHTASSVLAAAGTPMWLIGRILGQTQIQTTAGYTHEELGQITDALTAGLGLLELD